MGTVEGRLGAQEPCKGSRGREEVLAMWTRPLEGKTAEIRGTGTKGGRWEGGDKRRYEECDC